MGGEDWVSVADQGFWQAMNFDDVLDEERHDVLRRHGFRGGNEVRHLGEAIDVRFKLSKGWNGENNHYRKRELHEFHRASCK